MKWLGYKQVNLKAIVLDVSDIRKRTKAAHVTELASDIRTAGEEPIHAPTIRGRDKRLLCGRDRVAALLILKAKRIWVHVADCDDKEAKELELRENIYRRPIANRAELIAELVSLKAQQLRAAAAEGNTGAPLGDQSRDTVPPSRRVNSADIAELPSEQTIKSKARREVARAAGISPASVKKAEQRAAAKAVSEPTVTDASQCICERTFAEHDPNPAGIGCRECTCELFELAEDSPAGAPPTSSPGPSEPAAVAEEQQPAPTLDLLGCNDASTRTVCKFALPYQQAIDAADKLLRQTVAALKPIELTDIGQELRAQVQRVGELARSHRPASVCPWCKGLPKATFGLCGGCGGSLWVSAEKAARAPREAREAVPPIVLWNGVEVPYADALAGKFPAANGAPAKKSGKRISVVLPDGRTVDPQAEADAQQDADEAY